MAASFESASVLRKTRSIPSIVGTSVVLALGAMLGVPEFASSGNVVNVGLQVSILLMIAMPMTLVILSEGLDLSVGALLSLCAVVFAQTLGLGWGIAAALCVSVAVGMLAGFFNGALIAKLGLPPFVVTLGTLGIAHGIALILTDGNAVVVTNLSVSRIYASTVMGVPFPLIIALLTYAVTHLLLYHTKFGTYVFAIGGNRDALLLAGVKARAYHVAIYVFGGLIVGLAALVLVGRMNSAEPTSAIGMEFDAIAAVVLGGT
jgi:ribose transport system permease protein